MEQQLILTESLASKACFSQKVIRALNHFTSKLLRVRVYMKRRADQFLSTQSQGHIYAHILISILSKNIVRYTVKFAEHSFKFSYPDSSEAE